MKRCSSSISDTSSDTSSTSEPCSSDDDAVAAVDKKRKEEDEDLWHHLPFFGIAHQPDEPMDFSSECGDSSDFDYDMYDEAADHATWVEWAQREKEKKEVGVFFFNNNMG